MNIPKYHILILALLFSLISATAYAVMPPQIYAEKSMNSKIKAIAILQGTRTLKEGKHFSDKQAVFKLEYSLTENTPETFTADYKSIETKTQEENAFVGGNIYFYPVVGKRYYVTISEENGTITSLTELTDELEKVIKETPEKISYGFSKAYVE